MRDAGAAAQTLQKPQQDRFGYQMLRLFLLTCTMLSTRTVAASLPCVAANKGYIIAFRGQNHRR